MSENNEKDIIKEKNKKQKKKSVIRRILKFFFVTVLGLIGLSFFLYILMSTPWVQKKAVDFAVDRLKSLLQTELSIREVRIGLFNEINLRGVYLEDQQGDTLIYAEILNARFDLWKLIRSNTLLINGVDLEEADLNISRKDPDSPFNFQFLIDAFTRDSTVQDTTSSTLKINIDDINLKDIRLRYNVKSEPDIGNGFDVNHIFITDLFANLNLPSIDTENFEGEIKKLSLKEKSGLIISDLSGNIFSKGNLFYSDGILLKTPHSDLNIESIGYNLKSDEFYLYTNDTKIEPKEFTPLLSGLKNLNYPLLLNVSMNGKLPLINIDSLSLSYGESLIRASASVSDYSRYSTAEINFNIMKLSITPDVVTSFAKVGDSTFNLPPMLRSLGRIDLKGDVNGTLSDMNIALQAMTRQGGLILSGRGSMDTTFRNFAARGTLHTQNFNLRPFIGNSVGLGRLTGLVSFNVSQSERRSLNAEAKGEITALQYKNTNFRNIPFSAHYSAARMGAWLDADLPFGRIAGEVEVIRSRMPKYIFDIQTEDFSVAEFYKMEHWNDPSLSFKLKGELQGQDINTLLGDVVLDSLIFKDDNFHFAPGIITLKAGTNNVGRYIALRSSICDANLSGQFNFTNIYDELSVIIHPFLPDFFELPAIQRERTNKFDFDAFIDNTESLTGIMDLPLVLYQPLQVHLEVNTIGNKVDGYVFAPDIEYNKMRFTSSNMEFNCDSLLALNANTKYMMEKGSFDFDLKLDVESDTLQILLDVSNDGQNIDMNGSINAYANFSRNAENGLITTLSFIPTTINVGNLELGLLPGQIKNEKEKTYISNLGLSQKENDFLVINGIVSEHEGDSIKAIFNKTEIRNIFEAFDINNMSGEINGVVVINSVLGNPILHTDDFTMSDIIIFGDTLGTLSANVNWQSEKEQVDVDMKLANEQKGTNTTLKGTYGTVSEALDMTLNLDRLSLSWIQPFVSDFVSKLSGSLSANMNIKGSFPAPVTEGWLGLNDATFGVAYTNVDYHVTDTIRVSADKIGFDYLILTDDNGNYGLASATVTHHNFQDMKYRLQMQLYNLMVLDTEDRTDSLFFGKVYASGDVNIEGDDGGVNIQMNIMNSRNSNISVLLPQTSEATEYRSIVYINTPVQDEQPKEKEMGLPINVSVNLTLDPRIRLRAIIDPFTGDEMQIVGNGQINFSYNLRSERMTVFGDYTATGGLVRYNLQGLKTLTFQIREGSKLLFAGDPLQTQFNIVAYHHIRDVDLKILDQSFASDFTLTNTKQDVDIILNIKGNINKIDLSYDVTLPNSSEDVQRRVQSIISTDEQRTRQFASLAAFGTFYSGDAKGNFGSGIFTDLASGTLSAGLNSLFQNILGNRWEVGTNISASNANFSDVDVQVNVSRNFFNDRLKINTNVGYRAEPTITENPFIGDFDVEYRLTNNWTVKAYNHTNERYDKQANTTQGIGLVYTKDAKKLKDLFNIFSRKKE